MCLEFRATPVCACVKFAIHVYSDKPCVFRIFCVVIAVFAFAQAVTICVADSDRFLGRVSAFDGLILVAVRVIARLRHAVF